MKTYTHKGRQIETLHTYPPIPWRDYDWQAVIEGTEPGGLIGTGRCEQEAIDDLIEQLEDEDEEAV